MKITNVETFIVGQVPGAGTLNFVFVAVDTDEGLSGVGEATLWGRELPVAAAVEHLKPLLIGQDARRIEHLWQTLFRGGFIPAQRVLSSAISAVDMALWDIRGKALGAPVYDLLGGLVRDRVACYRHNSGGDAGDIPLLLASCRESVAEGWRCVRWGLPTQGDTLEQSRSIPLAIEQVAAVRQALGDDIGIILDVHTRLDPRDSVRLCRALEPYNPFFVEDPIRSENVQSLRLLRQQTSVPLAVGEFCSSKWEIREIIEEELADYARIDLGLVGGLTEARKIAGWCETHYIKLATHSPLGPVAAAASLHLNLACTNFGVQEHPRGVILTDLFPVQPDFHDGCLWPSARPGLGGEFDGEAARQHPFKMFDMPMLHRADGAITNW